MGVRGVGRCIRRCAGPSTGSSASDGSPPPPALIQSQWRLWIPVRTEPPVMSLRRPGPSVTAGAHGSLGGGGQERENGSRPDHLSFNRSASWQRSSVCRPRRRCRVRDGWRWMVEKPQKGKKSPKILLRRLLLIGPYQPAPKKPSPLFLFTQILRFHHCRSRKSRYELPLALPIFQTGPPDIWRRGE